MGRLPDNPFHFLDPDDAFVPVEFDEMLGFLLKKRVTLAQLDLYLTWRWGGGLNQVGLPKVMLGDNNPLCGELLIPGNVLLWEPEE